LVSHQTVPPHFTTKLRSCAEAKHEVEVQTKTHAAMLRHRWGSSSSNANFPKFKLVATYNLARIMHKKTFQADIFQKWNT